MKILPLALLLFLVSLSCFAQNTITGRIISQADTKPVVGASVFLSNATTGSATAADGSFTLKNVKAGRYELVVSIIGFESFSQPVTVTGSDIALPVITIFPKSIALNEVKISYRKDPERRRYFTWFEQEFLGGTDLARDCKILNPEVLDYDYDNKESILTVSSDDFLIIENNALGYNLKYLLKDFNIVYGGYSIESLSYSGSVMFEEMKGNAKEEREWKRRRREVYTGSLAHFLKSAIANRIEQNGFRALLLPANLKRPADSIIEKKIEFFLPLKKIRRYRDSLSVWRKKWMMPKLMARLNYTPLTTAGIVKGPDKQGFYTLDANHGALLVAYNQYHHFNRTDMDRLASNENTDNTLVYFNTPNVLFDRNGNLINTTDLTFAGAWGQKRIASLLPTDYDPQFDDDASIEVDSTLVKSITAKVNGYEKAHITEKAYLHFDKPYYAAGDTIYFKAYLTQGEEHAVSRLGRVLYVDLINTNNKISSTLKLLITDGVAWGDFALPRTFKKGTYRVRAYTRWMRNEREDAFFDKTIQVGSSIADNAPVQDKATALKPDIKFFPESGNLVAGAPIKIAFKAIGPNGLGIDVKGIVVDNDNRQVATFTSAHLGMGAFILTTAETQTYTAKVNYPDGTQDLVALPQVNPNAINMAFTDLDRFYAVKINSSKLWYRQNKGKSYTLVIYSGGMPQSFTVKLDNQEVSLDVLKRDFRSGIATATLFSAGGEPLCERLLFIQNNDLLKLNISTDKTTYAARTKAAIKLNVTGGTGDPAPGHFSVAVTDETKVPADDNAEPGIVGNILLTSDLKGYIEQPGYYFTNPDEKTAADLDLVMLTHGYRNFVWKAILDGPAPGPYQPETGLALSGTVKFKGQPLKNGKVKLFSRTAGGLILDTLSDIGGRFVFDNLSFDDTTKFVLQARTATGQKEVDIKPDSTLASPPITPKSIAVTQTANLSVYEQNSRMFLDEQDKNGINKNTHMLREVVVKDKRLNPLQHSDNLNGAGNADQVITAEWLEKSGYVTLYDALRAKANSLVFTPNHRIRSNRTIEGIDADHPLPYMLVIVDGTPDFMTDNEEMMYLVHGILENYTPEDIESVEILLGAHGAAIYGSVAAGGAIIITTKRGRAVNNYYKESPGVLTFKANGFYKARQFYAPKYEHAEIDVTKKDLRSTIYWNPNIITDKDGKASFEYFNSDGKGTYRVVVEGIDAEGNLGRQVFKYQVE